MIEVETGQVAQALGLLWPAATAAMNEIGAFDHQEVGGRLNNRRRIPIIRFDCVNERLQRFRIMKSGPCERRGAPLELECQTRVEMLRRARNDLPLP